MSVGEKLMPHLGDEERLLETHVEQRQDGTLGRVIAVTNQRLIRLQESRSSSGCDIQEVKTILLHGPHILGTSVEKESETEPDKGQLIIGLLFGAVGAVPGLIGLGDGEPILAMAGLVITVIGAYFAYDALDTDPGGIWLEILNTGERKGVALPEGADKLAETASKVVATANQ